ncbi:hypothetical protein ONZ45_g410 [Pleurotus djamor]|nr:hypothetical protein ONZ45_g410 [Pleurotus djamor]
MFLVILFAASLMPTVLIVLWRAYGVKKLHVAGVTIRSPSSLLINTIHMQRRTKTGDVDESLSIKRIRIQLHIPKLNNPRWCTFTATDVEQKDSKSHVSVSELHVALWIFPYLLRFTGGSWVSVDLDDFRLLVFTSENTPRWVENIRNNLIKSILTGEYLRLDTFNTSVQLSGDDTIASLSTENWHIRNWDERIYSLPKLDAQLCKSFDGGSGKFVMIAEDCRWMKVQSLIERAEYRNQSFLRQLLQSIAYFPSDVWKTCRDPMGTLDLYAPRADITFERFRIRDSELVREVGAKIREICQRSH